MKTAEKTGALPELIRQHRNAPELSRLTNALTLFLGQLNQALNPREKSSAVNAAAWSVEELRTIFLGLATCANPLCGLIFTNDQLKEVHPPLQGITDSLMRLAIAKNLRETADSASVWLDIMNWLSRAMKSGLITASANIKAFAPGFVQALLEWSAPNVEAIATQGKSITSPGTTTPTGTTRNKDPHQIGKCAVQVYPIYRFKLLGPERAGYENLKRLALNLCADAFLDRLEAIPMEVVAVVSMTNMVKDCLDAGLFSDADPQLSAIVPRLLKLVAMIPPAEMASDGGRTPGNCSNFLRTLIDTKLAGYADLAAIPETRFAAACKSVLAIAKAPAKCNAHTTANLLSFVKALDKCLPVPVTGKPIEPSTMQNEVIVAASNLIANAVTLRAASFVRPEALGGLLAGLAYFAARKLSLPMGALALMRALMDVAAQINHTQWSKQSRGNALRAMEIMLNEQILGIGDIREALPALLGEYFDPDGANAEGILHRAVSRLGAIREIVEPLPPLPSPPPAVAPPVDGPASAAPASPAIPQPRPGFTTIVPDRPTEAPTTAKAKKKTRTKRKTNPTEATAATTTAAVSSAASTNATAAPEKGKPSIDGVTATSPGKPRPDQTSHATGLPTASSSPATLLATAPSLVSRGSKQRGQSQTSRSPAMAGRTASSGKKQTGSEARNAHSGAATAIATATPQSTPLVATTITSVSATTDARADDGANTTVSATNKNNAVPKQKEKAPRITPQKKWFDLLKNEPDPLERLQELATSNPHLLNLKDTQDKSGRAAIFYAITQGHPDVVAWLMEQKRHRLADAPGAFLNTVLDSIAFEEPEIIQALEVFLDAALEGQPVERRAEWKTFSRAKARQFHKVSISLQMYGLLESNPEASPAVNRRSMLQSSESLADIESVLPPDHKAKGIAASSPVQQVSHPAGGPVSLALGNDISTLAKFLIANPAPDENVLLQCVQALELALIVRHHEMCAALVAYQDGAVLELAIRRFNPLINAANLHPETFRLLVEHQGGRLLDADAGGNTPLLAAIRHPVRLVHSVESVCLLISVMNDAQLSWTNPRGENALTLAAMNCNAEGNEKIARHLLARLPALAQQADMDGRTPLDYAVIGEHAALTKLLALQ